MHGETFLLGNWLRLFKDCELLKNPYLFGTKIQTERVKKARSIQFAQINFI